jgi:NAD(P)-dependent dehydrogenase (short-subunit alcohol dehydrogenase family)
MIPTAASLEGQRALVTGATSGIRRAAVLQLAGPRWIATGYYAAYVVDPDGNNIDVVNHHR